MTANSAYTTKTRPEQNSNLVWLVVLIGMVFAIYRDTWLSMLDIWLRIDTFSHCFLVMPISVYLIWRQRDEIVGLQKRSSILGVAAVVGLSIAWWLSMALGLQVGMHFAVVAMLPALVLAIYGMNVFQTLWFPLAFLGFTVPFGEIVIPELVDITASLAVSTVRAFGIPVIREGQFFEVSSGSYAVAKACAGLSFTIAALTLATLMAKLYFRKWTKGVLFVGAAIVLSIVANGVRAATIVLIMHYTDVDISAAKDHEFVGWLAYLLLIAFLLGIASWFSDTGETGNNSNWSKVEIAPTKLSQARGQPIWVTTLACTAAVGLGALLSTLSISASVSTQSLGQIPDVAGWQLRRGVEENVLPRYSGFTHSFFGTYSRGSETIYASLFSYQELNQGAEMISATNFVLPEEKWEIDFPTAIELEDKFVSTVIETVGRPRFGGSPVLVWYWYGVNKQHTTNTFKAKLMEAKQFLSFRPINSMTIILASPIVRSRDESRATLREFVDTLYPKLHPCIIGGPDADCDSAGSPQGPEYVRH